MDLLSNIRFIKTGLYLTLFFCVFNSFAQNTNSNNELILFRENIELNNSILSDTNSYVKLGNQSYIGDLSGVRSFYLSGNYTIKHTNQSYSLLGANIINGQYGPLINDLQFRLRYIHRLNITPNIQAAGGLELGFVNVFFESTPNTQGGSGFSPDINMMAALFGKKWKLGTSLNHLTSPIVQPINDRFRYYRNINLHGQYVFTLSNTMNLVTTYQSIFSSLKYFYRGNLSIVYNKKIEIGTGIKNEGFMFNIGLKRLKINNLYLSIDGGYELSKFTTNLNLGHLFQLHLGVFLK